MSSEYRGAFGGAKKAELMEQFGRRARANAGAKKRSKGLSEQERFEHKRLWYRLNREKRIAAAQAYNAAHPDRVKKYRQTYEGKKAAQPPPAPQWNVVFTDLSSAERRAYAAKYSAGRKRYMYFAEYQALARRTQNPHLPPKLRLKHALCGLMSEVGEIAAHYQKEEQGHRLVTSEVAMELGDLLWFVAEMCDVLGYDMETIAKWNIEKLKERYPAGFSPEASIHRRG